ncbi:MAG: EAL domain-containing protein [Magnetococcales bacterium]|nr:EAL domain-containing protein [Magnetococcales bacterium]
MKMNNETILVVDDNPDNIRLMGHILDAHYHIQFATNGEEALASVADNPPDMILLDVMMPGIDGFEVCRRLRQGERSRDIPVILVTALNDPAAEIRGFSAGAVDFLSKPVNPPVVRARVGVHLALKRQREALERTNRRLAEENARRMLLEEQLREQAEYDALTGLPNRKLFQDRLEQTILMVERNQGSFSLMFLDLDRFKWVNDTLGHDAGDQLLVEVSRRLRGVVRKSDTVARLGGDEFTVILSDILHESMAELVARKILEQLSTPFVLKGQEVTISGSVGIAIFPADGGDAQELAKNADCAMYQAKEGGRNAFRFYSQEINRQAHRRMRLEAQMRHACGTDEFFLDYQPKISLVTGCITGMEALLRWNHPEEGILFPKQFMPLAEGTGLIIQIGAWVLRTACRDAMVWDKEGYGSLKLAVNLSALQFREGDKLVELVEDVLQETGFPPERLELEITETMMMGNTEAVCATLHRLVAMGIVIAMDDFGTGYSSLALLKRLPIHVIKIDRSFVSDLRADSNTAFISAIISMARQLRLHVVVEGVETIEQLRIMEKQGGDDVQGFFFSPPLGKEGMLALLQGRIPLGGSN